MENKYLYIVIFLLTSMISCNDNSSETEILMTVVKYESALANNEIKIAEKYIDMNQVYKEISSTEGRKQREIWEEFIGFKNTLGSSSRKFTSCFKYHDYDILVTSESSEAIVKFYNSNSVSMKYVLEKKDMNWIIVKITYLRQSEP